MIERSSLGRKRSYHLTRSRILTAGTYEIPSTQASCKDSRHGNRAAMTRAGDRTEPPLICAQPITGRRLGSASLDAQ